MRAPLKTPVAEGDPALRRRGNRRDWFPGGPGGEGVSSFPDRTAWHIHFFQTSGVTPGTATGSTGFGPNSNVLGVRSSFEAFIAHSQEKARPV